jgi:hypothetical protein
LLIFADISETEKPKWLKFKSEKELENFEAYRIAKVARKNGKVVMSIFTLSSGSGDWVKYVYYYFRENGTLAKIESQLNTFYGHFTVLQDIYFNNNGKVLKKTTRYLDLETQNPKKPSKDDFLNNGDNFNHVNFYKKTNKLPFTHLLNTNKK